MVPIGTSVYATEDVDTWNMLTSTAASIFTFNLLSYFMVSGHFHFDTDGTEMG